MKRRLETFLAFMFLCVGIATAQVSNISGVVISAEDNQPVVGASVLVKGTTVGTITDLDGKYTINKVPANAKTLVISYVGMNTQELGIKSNLRVVLTSNAKVLDEVVVVAY